MGKYDFKDFTGKSLRDTNLDDMVIVGSCFAQEGHPYQHIFNDTMKGVTFRRCNLDNVYIPPGNIMDDCSNRQIMVQNDLRDWEVDEHLFPVRVVNEKAWIASGKTVDPQDIPAERLKDISEIKDAAPESIEEQAFEASIGQEVTTSYWEKVKVFFLKVIR